MTREKRGMDFVRNKIKGKIAEIIFQHMLAENDFATIIPFGYEHSAPMLAQYQHLLESSDDIADIRDTPDFLIMKPDHKQAVLTEVKYRKHKEPAQVQRIATKIDRHWKSAWLFLATCDGFFFAPCSVILAQHGDIPRLPVQWIPQDIQDKYFQLLLEFER